MSYKERRHQLHRILGQDKGTILLLGASLQPRNYPDNPYMPFRQNAHFLYYTGVREPGFALLSFPDGTSTLLGPKTSLDTIVWTGPQKTLEQHGEAAQVTDVQPIQSLSSYVSNREDCLYLKPFQADALLALSRLFRCRPHEVELDASKALARAISKQRSIKEDVEIQRIEDALSVTRRLFHAGMQKTHVGMKTSALFGFFAQEVFALQRDFAFPPIVTCHGEILHNHHYDEVMKEGRLLLVDMGTETQDGYTSDITRTWPVNGRYDSRQKELYEIVLRGQCKAIENMKPGLHYREAHWMAAESMVEGLVRMGLMKGAPKEAVKVGAHALFFPHGLGHMMGLDVHDMEDLGDIVGYGEQSVRSEQFGLNFLRLSRPLEQGHVVTVEPGLYFIPALFEQWRTEKRHAAFLCYDVIERFMDVGGIRIEDDVLITSDGARILGEPIAKSCDEVEAWMRSSDVTR